MSKRRVRCLSAVSVFALSLAWTSAQSIVQAGELQVQVVSIATANVPVQSASDLLMSLTLKGYDLFSVGQFRAALEEANLPATAVLAPDILASLRSLELGEAHMAAVASVLQVSASPMPVVVVAEAVEPIQIDLDLQLAALTCDNTADLQSCTVEPEDKNPGRGVENYSG
jgi:hypothetical protein